VLGTVAASWMNFVALDLPILTSAAARTGLFVRATRRHYDKELKQKRETEKDFHVSTVNKLLENIWREP
jgi:hypothetical protein